MVERQFAMAHKLLIDKIAEDVGTTSVSLGIKPEFDAAMTEFRHQIIAVPQLGYLPTTILFAMILAYRLGYRGWPYMASAAAFAIVVVVIFKAFLQVKVPGGAIYEFLPTAARSFMLTYF